MSNVSVEEANNLKDIFFGLKDDLNRVRQMEEELAGKFLSMGKNLVEIGAISGATLETEAQRLSKEAENYNSFILSKLMSNAVQGRA